MHHRVTDCGRYGGTQILAELSYLAFVCAADNLERAHSFSFVSQLFMICFLVITVSFFFFYYREGSTKRKYGIFEAK